MNAVAAPARPRLGFLGTGWIGRHRLRALVQSGVVEVAALADPAAECLRAAAQQAPGARLAADLDALLDSGIDGIVIATPSALHAEQAEAALDAGIAVFCQKPLGRSAAETERVVRAARRNDRLLGVDLSYRHTAAALAVREQVAAAALGPVHAVDLVFHNAYGPDKPWFQDPALSGGGCVIDLAIHLVDLLLWTLDWPAVERVQARRWRRGEPAAADEAEDFCLATLELAGGTVARLACSWFSHEGRDAVIETTYRGRDGAAALHNVDGSFYDFIAELRAATTARTLATPPDDWGGRAAVAWARRLADGKRYDPAGERLVTVARVIDSVYGR
ncbi:MAG TPA: Gfo/Idh/MocA family oxidoreductase [Solirubrobacteraceae bacterium]|nr:Gfo/Idh/MocA family oxidoreductase [Solirubrobacteraceae bacterium]